MSKKEEIIGELGEAPNEKYKKLFDSFKDIETLEVSKWKPNHLLGYFCKKYQDQYNCKYNFKFNNPSPAKSYEIYQIKKLGYMLSSDPAILKEYIDWVYQVKVQQAKRKLTSIAFMTVESLVGEFKTKYVLNATNNVNNNINRSTELPEKYAMLFKNAGMPVKTYGDLSFINQMPEKSQEIKNAFENLRVNGFDLSLLKKVI